MATAAAVSRRLAAMQPPPRSISRRRAREIRRRFRYLRRRGLLLILVALLLLAARVGRRFLEPPPPAPPRSLATGVYQVARVVDGDTLLLANRARVRLIGVDTPEVGQPVSREATRFTRAWIAGGGVRLTFDRERVDRYGRLLAYVWIGDRMLNEELLRAGFARARLSFHYSAANKRRFQEAEAIARGAGRGIWAR